MRAHMVLPFSGALLKDMFRSFLHDMPAPLRPQFIPRLMASVPVYVFFSHHCYIDAISSLAIRQTVP